jgi:hypothetical protein
MHQPPDTCIVLLTVDDVMLCASRSDYTATEGDYFYRMNVCGPVSAGGPCGNALVCQYSAKDQHFVAKIAVYDGYFGPRLTLIDGNNPGLGVQAHYLNGDICFIGPTKKRNPRTTIVQYRCARETKDTFTIHEDKDTCTFTITMETTAACWPPGSMAGSISNGTTFLILSVRHSVLCCTQAHAPLDVAPHT